MYVLWCMFLAPKVVFPKSTTNNEIMYVTLDLPTSWKEKDGSLEPCFKRLCWSCLKKYEVDFRSCEMLVKTKSSSGHDPPVLDYLVAV